MTAAIGLAVIGAGKIARDRHFPAIAESGAFVLEAVVDPTGSVAGVPTFADVAELVAARLPIDAVVICTPPQVRGAIAAAAIAAGWHVLLEKPPSATLAELAALTSAARAAGTTLFAAWHSREAPMVAAARDFLAGRAVAAGRVTWREDVRRWHPGQAWLWAPGGLGVFDPGINAFSILTRILPMPPIVRRATLDTPVNAHTPIAARLTLSSGDAPIAVDLDFRQAGPQSWEIAIETTCGHALLLSDGGAALSIDGSTPRRGPDCEYPRLYARFAGLIAAGTSDADAAPLRLVADALLVAEVRRVAPFVE